MVQAFAYHRAVAPMMWVFVGLASIELLVVHLLLSHWSRPGALVMSVLTLASIGWLVNVIRSFSRLPVLITPDTLVMRVGTLRRVTIPLTSVAGLRDQWDAAALKQPGVARLSLIAYPNVVIDLDPPLAGRRTGVKTVAHRLDDPAAFTAALAGRLNG